MPYFTPGDKTNNAAPATHFSIIRYKDFCLSMLKTRPNKASSAPETRQNSHLDSSPPSATKIYWLNSHAKRLKSQWKIPEKDERDMIKFHPPYFSPPKGNISQPVLRPDTTGDIMVRSRWGRPGCKPTLQLLWLKFLPRARVKLKRDVRGRKPRYRDWEIPPSGGRWFHTRIEMQLNTSTMFSKRAIYIFTSKYV